MPHELRETEEQYLHEEKVVAINGLLFNYAMDFFLPMLLPVSKKLVEYDLLRLDENKYGVIEKGFSIKHAGKEIVLNYSLGLCEAYVTWRYAKFAHVDNNFLRHVIAACWLQGI